MTVAEVIGGAALVSLQPLTVILATSGSLRCAVGRGDLPPLRAVLCGGKTRHFLFSHPRCRKCSAGTRSREILLVVTSTPTARYPWLSSQYLRLSTRSAGNSSSGS